MNRNNKLKLATSALLVSAIASYAQTPLDSNANSNVTTPTNTQVSMPPGGMPPGGMPPGGMPPGGMPPGGMPPGGMPPGGMPFGMGGGPVEYNSIIDIKDGQLNAKSSVIDKKNGAVLTNTVASNLKLRTTADQINPFIVRGKTKYTISNSNILQNGKGKSDFDGIAAGVLARDESNLKVDNVNVVTNGIVSPALVATDKSIVVVNNSSFVANGGATPSGYVRRLGPGMMEPPTPLGIIGTARTVLVMGESKTYINNSKITADAWGALSTDAARGAYLEANNCDVTVVRSGYGTYADNGAHVVINKSRMNVAQFQGIIAGQAKLEFDGVTGKSGGSTVMIHNVMGGASDLGTLSIKNSDFRSRNAALLVKSANALISIDKSNLISENGDILLSVLNDDGNATKVGDAKVPGIIATISNSSVNGNLIHKDTDRRMTVKASATNIRGIIQDLELSLDATSKWVATGDSKVLLADADITRIDAISGVNIDAMSVKDLGFKGVRKLPSGGTITLK